MLSQLSTLPSPMDCKSHLKENNFLYLQTDDPKFGWVEFSRKITGCELTPQYGNQLVFHVKSEPEFLELSDAKSQNALLPHTEASDFQTPPKYMALWCEEPSSCGGGATTLSRVQSFLPHLSKEELIKLMSTPLCFKASNGIHIGRTGGAISPILSFVDGKPKFRFSYNYLKHGDYSPNPDHTMTYTPEPFVENICDRFLNHFERTCVAISMKRYSLLLWDNEQIVHSRKLFTDQKRSLKRIFLR